MNAGANNQSDPIVVTDNAIKRIASIMEQEGDRDLFLRLSVSGGGCSGFQYHFDLTKNSGDDDVVVTRDGVKVAVDSMSLMYILGSKLDFVENLTGSYFKVDNPNAVSGCGCGTSFSI